MANAVLLTQVEGSGAIACCRQETIVKHHDHVHNYVHVQIHHTGFERTKPLIAQVVTTCTHLQAAVIVDSKFASPKYQIAQTCLLWPVPLGQCSASIDDSVFPVQGCTSSSVSYMVPSCSKQVGVQGGLACLPHLVIRPPNLRQSNSCTVQQNMQCLQSQVCKHDHTATLLTTEVCSDSQRAYSNLAWRTCNKGQV